MSRRPTLPQLRRALLFYCLDEHHWRTPSDCQQLLRLGGHEWYRIALVLERLAADGLIELKGRGSRVRRFRLRQTS